MPIRKREQRRRINKAIAALDEFCDVANWKRSHKGNLYRDCQGMNVCVFRRPDGTYGYSIDCGEFDDGLPNVGYSPIGWETADDAMTQLAHLLMINEV